MQQCCCCKTCALGCLVLSFTSCLDSSSMYSVLLQEGLIINLGSVAALEPMKSTPVYAASKWGLRGWSLSCYEVRLQLQALDSYWCLQNMCVLLQIPEADGICYVP